MDSGNVGRQAQNDAEARAIRSVMIQKREALRRIEREMAQLAENKREIVEDLVRLGVALAPHNDSVLPNEILSHIFVLAALAYGTVRFPIPKDNAPPQFVASHVCSHWRRVALRTPELWSDTHLIYPMNNGHLHQRWLFRARTFPAKLSIKLDEFLDSDESVGTLQSILLPIQVKRLGLCLTREQFTALSTLPAVRFSEFELDVTLDGTIGIGNINMNDPHPLMTRLQSVTFRFAEHTPDALNWIDLFYPSLPWSQLRSLNFDIDVEDPHLIFGILRGTPVLEALILSIYCIGISDQLTMPSLRDFSLDLISYGSVDNHAQILRSFTCPSLTKFSLATSNRWTCETFEILTQQYNMQELVEATIYGDFALPVSSFLQEAPMLHSLSLGRNAIMDEEAVIGISNGTLGRFLRSLFIKFTCDVGEVLGMAEARKKTVDELIQNGCSWREEIAVLKDIVVQTRTKPIKRYEERVVALKEVGIDIMFL